MPTRRPRPTAGRSRRSTGSSCARHSARMLKPWRARPDGSIVPRRGLLLALVALSALLALPAFAGAQDWGSGLFDETEPDATVTKVKVNAHKGLAKVYFVGSDPVDAPEDLSYDCEVDGGDHGGSSDDGSDDDESRTRPPARARRRPSVAYSSPPEAKSSGVTSSRKSLNFSTTSSVSSTSCSNSIEDSSITSSAAKIGAEVRTASARASEGRESISISEPLTEIVIDA